MKIHFNGVNFSSTSGPNTFATRLAHQLSLNGHIIADPGDYDIGLIFIEPSERLAVGKPHVLRLDGIWFSPDEFHTKNSGIRFAYDNVDSVIFQSEFDRQMVERWWGVAKSGAVIRNGTSLKRVETQRDTLLELRQKYERIYVCSANWHPQKRLRTNIELFKHIRNTTGKNSCLVVMGNNPDVIDSDRNVFYTGGIPQDICLEFYSIADWMIHLAWLDHCPNTCVEAMSQGCPVICTEAGGTRELVGESGLVLKESQKYAFELTNYDSPPPLDVTQVTHLPDVTVDTSNLDIVKVTRAYENVFDTLIKSHVRSEN